MVDRLFPRNRYKNQKIKGQIGIELQVDTSTHQYHVMCFLMVHFSISKPTPVVNVNKNQANQLIISNRSPMYRIYAYMPFDFWVQFIRAEIEKDQISYGVYFVFKAGLWSLTLAIIIIHTHTLLTLYQFFLVNTF